MLTKTLAERLANLRVVVDVTNAMAYAHAEGVIHRDLKPANLLVGRFGEVVVIDWASPSSSGRRPSTKACATTRGTTA